MVILENHTIMETLRNAPPPLFGVPLLGGQGLQYNKSFVHLNHILHIFFILSPILSHLPSLVQRRDLSIFLHLHTRCLACLIPLYDLFIVNGKKKNTQYYWSMINSCRIGFLSYG